MWGNGDGKEERARDAADHAPKCDVVDGDAGEDLRSNEDGRDLEPDLVISAKFYWGD